MQVIAIVLPMIIQNSITNIMSLVDNVMIGLVGTLQMSAVAIVNQLILVFNLCVFGSLAGIGILSTQYVGAKDNDGVRYCFRAKIIISVLMVALAYVVFLLLPKPLISMYIAEGTATSDAVETLGYAISYLKIMLVGLLPFTAAQIYSCSLREIREVKLPMVASIISILINIVLNYFLIFGKFGFPCLGVRGAAIATVISRFVEAAIIIISTRLKRHKYPFIIGVFRSIYIPFSLCKNIITKGMPLIVNEFLCSAGMALILQCYSVRGLQVVAAVNISNTVSNLFNIVFISVGSAIAIIVGQCLGANDIERAKSTVRQLLSLAIVVCLIMGSIMALLAPIITSVYNTEIEVRRMATKLLYIVAFFMPITSFALNCYFTIRSGGRTFITILFDGVFIFGVAMPVAFILSKYTSMPILQLFFAVQSLDFLKCIIGFILVKRGIWIRNIINK